VERKTSKKSIIFKLPVASSRWFLGMIFRHSTALRYLKLLVGRSPACMQPMAKIRWAGGEKPKVLEAALLLKMFLGYQTKRLESRSFILPQNQGNKTSVSEFCFGPGCIMVL